MCAPRALGFVPSRVFRLYRGDNVIQDYSTKNRRVSGLGSSFGEPQRLGSTQNFPGLASGLLASIATGRRRAPWGKSIGSRRLFVVTPASLRGLPRSRFSL